MACGACGGAPRVVTGFNPSKLADTDVVPLLSAPDCAQRYTGQAQTRKVFVVGRGTADERVFRWNEAIEAARYAREVRKGLQQFYAGQLCSDLIVPLYG